MYVYSVLNLQFKWDKADFKIQIQINIILISHKYTFSFVNVYYSMLFYVLRRFHGIFKSIKKNNQKNNYSAPNNFYIYLLFNYKNQVNFQIFSILSIILTRLKWVLNYYPPNPSTPTCRHVPSSLCSFWRKRHFMYTIT